MILNRWLKRLFGSSNRNSRRAKRALPRVRHELLLLEDRVTPVVTAGFFGGTLTVSLSAANDAAFIQMDGANVDVGTTSGAENVLPNQAGVTRIVVQDIGPAGDQSVTFTAGSGAFNLSGGLQSTGVETVTILQAVSTSTSNITIDAAKSIAVQFGGSLTATTGDITLSANMQATPTAGDFVGVNILGGGVTTGGAVSISGRGGNGIANQFGVVIQAATISSGAGSTIVNGTGGPSGGNGNIGVFLATGTSVTSNGGGVTISGQGGGTGISANSHGVEVSGGSTVTTTGTGTISVSGTAGSGSGPGNHGVNLTGAGSAVSSGGGPVIVTGNGGGTATSFSNYGVAVLAGAEISAAGTGNLTVVGSGGGGSGNLNRGIYLSGAGSTISTVDGNVLMTGNGGTGAAGSNFGMEVSGGGTVTSTGTGKVTVNGTGGAGTGSFNYGVRVSNAGSKILSSGGAVQVSGFGGGTGPGSGANVGVIVTNGGVITAGLTGAVTVSGTGGPSTGSSNNGVDVFDSGSTITSSGGTVQVNGTGGAGPNHFGVNLDLTAKILAGANGTLGITTDTINTAAGTQIGGTSNGTQTITNSGAGTIAGIIAGPSAFIKQGAGDLTLTSSSLNTYTGTTTVNAGKLFVNGSIATSPTTTVNVGTTLGGTGNVGKVVLNGGTFAPGNSPGITLSSGISGSGTLALEVNPPAATAGTDFDQVQVAGTVDLSSITLSFSGTASPPAIAAGQKVTLITNDLADAITPSPSFAEGSEVVINGNVYKLTYAGGDGNDLVLEANTVAVTIAAPTAVAEDSGNSLTYTFTRSGATTNPLTVNFSLTGLASASNDYSVTGAASFNTGSQTGTVTIPAGQASASIIVTPTLDTTVELNETVVAGVNSGIGYVPAAPTAAGTIANDDTSTITIDNPSVNEDTGTITFTVTLSNPVDVAVTMQADSAVGGANPATPGVDYTALVASPVSIPANTTSKAVVVTVTPDSKVELDETLNLVLSNLAAGGRNVAFFPVGPTLTGTGTILNDDTAVVTLTPVSATLAEGNAGTILFKFAATLNNAVTGGFKLAYTTNDGTATTADGDYADNDSTLTFGGTAGEQQFILVTVNGDTIVEDNETFTVVLGAFSDFGLGIDPSKVSAAGSPQTGTITNDDTASLSITAPVIAETNTNQNVNFTVTLDKAVQGGFNVDFASALGTAGAGDFTVVTASPLAFTGTAGESHTITVTIVGDPIVEADETFTLTLGNVSGTTAIQDAAITTGANAAGTIVNDDSAVVTLTPINAMQSEGDTGTTAFTFKAQLDNPVQGGFNLAYTTNDVSAFVADNDYQDNDGTLNFIGTANEFHTITVLVNGDTIVELNETFNVALGAFGGFVGVNPAKVTSAGSPQVGTITNDDQAIAVTITPAQATEGSAVLFTAKLSKTVDVPVQITLTPTVEVGDSAEATDFSGAPLIITIPAGMLTGSVNVVTNPDDLLEGDETFTATLSNIQASGRNVIFTGGGATLKTTGTIFDDETGVISFVAANSTTPEGGTSNVQATLAITVVGSAGPGVLEQPLTVNLTGSGTVAVGRADSGTDYTLPATPMFTFPAAAPNGNTQVAAVSITDDRRVEGPEFDILTFATTNPAGDAALKVTTSGNHQLNITDNDSAAFTFALPNTTTVEGGTANVSVVLTITSVGTGTEELQYPITFDLKADGTVAPDRADLGTDYTLPTSPMATFAAGAATGNTQAVLVPIVDDRRVEGPQFDVLSINPATFAGNAVLQIAPPLVSTTGSHTLNITDNDTLTLTFDAPQSVSENNLTIPRTATLTINAIGTGTIGLDFGLSYAVTTTGTATNAPFVAGDYTFSTPNIAFTAGNFTTQTFVMPNVSIFEDLTNEADETIIFNATVVPSVAPVGVSTQALAVTSTGTITIQNDDATTRTYDATTTGNYRFVRNGANLELYLGAVLIATDPIEGPPSPVILNGTTGDDTLTIDFSGGNPFPSGGITFNGNGGNDGFFLAGGGPFATVAHTLTSDTSGSVVVDGNNLFSYQNTEFGSDLLNTNERSFSFTGGPETITVSDVGGNDGNSLIDSGAQGMPWVFTNPNVQLTIDGGSGDDTIAVNGIDAGYKASLTITGGAGNDSITINPALVLGSATSNGAVSLTAELITLNNSISNTAATADPAGAFTFDGAVRLGVPVTLTTKNGPVTFTGTVDSEAGEANPLTITSGTGAVLFNGAVGSAPSGALGAITVSSAGTTTFNGPVTAASVLTDLGGTTNVNGGSVTTTGTQQYDDAVNVGANTTFTAGANITFNGTLGGAFAVAVNTPATGTFNKAVNVGSLTTDAGGTTNVNGGSVTTTGEQKYGDDVVAGNDTTFTGSAVTFDKTLTGPVAITVATGGATTFNGVVNVGSLATDGAGSTVVNGGSVTTSGDQRFDDPVTVGADTTFTSTTGNVTFNSTLNGPFNVTVNSPGATTFNGAVSVKNLATDTDGTTNVNGGSVTTTESQVYGDPVVLGNAATFAAGGDITFQQTLSGNVAVALNSPNKTTFNGAVNVGSLTTDGVGSTVVNGGSVTTTGDQRFDDPVTVGADTTFTSTTGKVTFNSTLNGPFNVAANSPAATTFNGVVSVKNLATDAPGTTNVNGGSVTTTESQVYGDPVVLGNAATFAAGGDITFQQTLSGNVAVVLNSPNKTTFNGAVNVGSLTTDAGGTTNVNGGSVTTTGEQKYGDDVVAGNDTTFTGSAVTFGKTLTGPVAITVASPGATTFNGVVNVGSLATDGAGSTVVNGGSVTTTGDQRFDDPVTVGADTTFTSTTGNVTFNNTLNGPFNVTANSPAATTFNGGVSVKNLATDAPGTTNVNGGSVTTTESQVYGDPVVLGNAATFAAGGDITFQQTLSGNVAVVLNSPNKTTFNGAVNVGSLATDGVGSTVVNGGSVTTSGDQRFDDPVTVGADTTFTSTTGNVTFNSTLNGPFNVTANSPAATTFNGVVNVGSLTTDKAGRTVFGTNNVTTATDQTYNDPVIIEQSSHSHTAGGSLRFLNSVTSPGSGANFTAIAKSMEFAGVVGAFNEFTLDARGTGVTQTGGAITAKRLTLTNQGSFKLAQSENDFDFLRVQNVSGGEVCVRDTDELKLDLDGGFTTTDANVNLAMDGDFTAIDERKGPSQFSSPLINLGKGSLTVQPGLAGKSTVTFNTEVMASKVVLGTNPNDKTFCGVAVGGNTQADTFIIRPSETTPITVYGDSPFVAPGDTLEVGIAGLVVTNFQYNGQDGFFTFSNRAKIDFFSIESLAGRRVEAFAVLTGEPRDANLNTRPNFAFRVVQTINNQNVGGGINGEPFPENAFVVSPALVNPSNTTGAPRIAFGDVNGDGVQDLVVASGPGSSPLVTVIDGNAINVQTNGKLRTVSDLFSQGLVLSQFFAYDPRFVGGVNVATGDMDGDGRAEIITGADIGGGPHVRIFSLDTSMPATDTSFSFETVQYGGANASFFAFNPEFRGGVRVSAGDINKDGAADLIIGAGTDGGPRVTVRDGKTGATLADFFAYDPNFRGGIFVDAEDINGDGVADILTGAGPSGGPHVRVFDGALVLNGEVETNPSAVLVNFMAFGTEGPNAIFGGTAPYTFGVGDVAFGGANALTGNHSILVSTSRGPRTEVRRFEFNNKLQLVSPPQGDDLLQEGQTAPSGASQELAESLEIVPPSTQLTFGGSVDGFSDSK